MSDKPKQMTLDEAGEHLDDVLGDAGAVKPEILPAVIEPPLVDDSTPGGRALTDMRSHALSLDSASMKLALADYSDRRQTFRQWLLAQLVEGVHYGYPPGCEPTYNDKGQLLQKVRGGHKVADEKQWTPKQSLYKAGADFIVDLMGVLPVYESDLTTWTQCGSTPMLICYVCRLTASDGTIVGEGRGAHQAKNAGDANRALKMAKKCSKVDAVLDAYGLSDLFTQDIEDGSATPEARENPKSAENQTNAATRGKAVDSDVVTFIVGEWKVQHSGKIDEAQMFPAFQTWVAETTGRQFNPRKTVEWTKADGDKCCEALGIQP